MACIKKERIIKNEINLLLLITIMLLASPIAKAITISNKNLDKIKMTGDNITIYEDIIDERLREKTLPTSGLDLGLQSYKATIVRASREWVYTNCYFIVDSDKTINVYYELSSLSGKNARIGVYDMTSGEWIKIVINKNSKPSINRQSNLCFVFL